MATGTLYPTALDSFVNQINGDDILPAETNTQSSAIEQIQAKLGITASAVTTTVEYKLKKLLGDGAMDNHVLTRNSALPLGVEYKANPAGFADPLTTMGDIIYNDGVSTTRLPKGNWGQSLITKDNTIGWSDLRRFAVRSYTNTWADRAWSADKTNIWKAICVGDISLTDATKQFVAVCSSAVDKFNMANSWDGVTWTLRAIPNAKTVQDVVWFPAVGYFAIVNNSNVILHSHDGITWVEVACYSDTWRSICYSSDLNMICAVAASGDVMTSTDGANFNLYTNITDGVPVRAWSSVIWDTSISSFVAVSSDASNAVGAIMTSPDGQNWTAQDAPVNKAWTSVTYSPELDMLLAICPDRLMFSQDGAAWGDAGAITSNVWKQIAWCADLGIFVAVGGTGAGDKCFLSLTFIDATDGTKPFFGVKQIDFGGIKNVTWNGIAYNPSIGVLAAVGGSAGDKAIMTTVY